MSEDQGRHYDIPSKIRSIVYLIGTLGFPIVVAGYVLIVLSGDLKNMNRSIVSLSSRIYERPMGLDKSSDFVIYLTDSLKNELISGLYNLADEIDLTHKPHEDVDNILARAQRQIESYVRPIIRKHKRFAERFPSKGGNLGSMFFLTAAAEKIDPGEVEGYLSATSSKGIGESIKVVIMNNFEIFGNITRQQSDTSNVDDSQATIEILDKEIFVELSKNAISSSVTAMRDQMLLQIKKQSTDFDPEKSLSDSANQ